MSAFSKGTLLLQAQLRKERNRFTLDLSVRAESASTLVLVGESGSGKTTVLRLLAGLEHPDSGSILLGETTYVDSARNTFIPPERRSIGYVAQDYALFPHLTVYENVAFGLQSLRIGRQKIRKKVSSMLERFSIESFAERLPSQLSGGQQQRVALARALILEPDLLLLDEPLSALDIRTRRSVRSELRQILEELPCITIYVTHQPNEALMFGNRIAVLEEGRITQEGSREDLLHHPRSTYIAEFMGLNLFRGRVIERVANDHARVKVDESIFTIPDPGERKELFLAVHPREITLYRQLPEGSAKNILVGSIHEIVPEPPFGERFRVVVNSRPPMVTEILRSSVESMALKPGEKVYASFKSTGVKVYE